MRTHHVVTSLAVIAATTAPAWGFGEDITTDDHSTAHYDMTLAFARCAGFSADEARTIAEADQVTDTLAYGSTAFAFTDRAGPDKSYFHFPEDNGGVDAAGDGPLRTWASGASTLTDLTGATLGICDAAGTCCDSAGQCVTAGSLESVGVWLHAVADFWSHHACIAAGGRDHGTYDEADPDQAAYCPTSMHAAEWGARATSGYAATLQANAIQGLRMTRDLLASYAAAHGKTACGSVPDDELIAFASGIPTARVETAAGLYAVCDAAPACAAPPAADADADPGTTAPGGGGGGCDGAPGSVGVLAAVVVALIGLGRGRRRRDARAR